MSSLTRLEMKWSMVPWGCRQTEGYSKYQDASLHSHVVVQQVAALDCAAEQSFGQKLQARRCKHECIKAATAM